MSPCSRVLAIAAVALVLCASREPLAAPGEARLSRTSSAAEAQEGTAGDGEPDAEEPGAEVLEEAGSGYRNPAGSIALSGMFGASFGDSGTRFVFALGVGYAVLTGVVPGVRGLIATGAGDLGGELAATLTLTPPISTSITPFAVGEVGRRFEPDELGGGAWMYGAGVGAYLGDPDSRFALQLGWMFRRLSFDDADEPIDASGPLVSIAARL